MPRVHVEHACTSCCQETTVITVMEGVVGVHGEWAERVGVVCFACGCCLECVSCWGAIGQPRELLRTCQQWVAVRVSPVSCRALSLAACACRSCRHRLTSWWTCASKGWPTSPPRWVSWGGARGCARVCACMCACMLVCMSLPPADVKGTCAKYDEWLAGR